jgi:hypothetical protein
MRGSTGATSTPAIAPFNNQSLHASTILTLFEPLEARNFFIQLLRDRFSSWRHTIAAVRAGAHAQAAESSSLLAS